MTPWHRFWFPRSDESQPQSRDAALWTPQAIAETQREVWQHAAQATEDWWRYWRSLWPSVPVQPPAGVVTPPMPAVEQPETVAAHPEKKSAPPHRRRAPARPSEASAPAVAKRARPVARGR